MASVVVDSGRSFLNETREIAFEYVNLCYSSEASTEPEMGQEARSPASGRRVAPDSDTVAGAGGPPPPTTAAFTIAQRLKMIGDRIDETVQKELQQALFDQLKPASIYQLGADQFSEICRKVLSSCSRHLHSGWEQASVVFMGMFGVIHELRAQGAESTRENLVNGFAGEALQDLRLESWINDHGGMAHFGDEVPGVVLDTVPIEGTSV
ncbi:uncharacterized protein LOC135343913 [Halichondria panicea]|uniref:uncharacterized protein LOC135343913 n=1 Tax=Halichondria panicea TaxID=6063 RepID=UPI00312B477C